LTFNHKLPINSKLFIYPILPILLFSINLSNQLPKNLHLFLHFYLSKSSMYLHNLIPHLKFPLHFISKIPLLINKSKSTPPPKSTHESNELYPNKLPKQIKLKSTKKQNYLFQYLSKTKIKNSKQNQKIN
jgi:hypothetical protein